jgi:hypothetical protein
VVLDHGGPGLESSLLAASARLAIPLTVHVAVGTDIVHMTPRLDGAALGQATLDDFRRLCGLVARLAGGVWLNLGSAVVLPEVFLKAVAVVRNLGYDLDGLTTANLDFHQQYRGLLNVLQRPGAEGIALTGHHELMIPLLHAAVVARLGSDDGEATGRRIPGRWRVDEGKGQRAQDRGQVRGQRTEGTGQRTEGTGQRVQGTGHRAEGTGQRTEDRGQVVDAG